MLKPIKYRLNDHIVTFHCYVAVTGINPTDIDLTLMIDYACKQLAKSNVSILDADHYSAVIVNNYAKVVFRFGGYPKTCRLRYDWKTKEISDFPEITDEMIIEAYKTIVDDEAVSMFLVTSTLVDIFDTAPSHINELMAYVNDHV